MVTEVTSESWFSRLGSAFKGIIIGIVLIVGSVAVLFWNEGRTVTTARSLDEGAGLVVSVAADSVDANNEGSLVHVTGRAHTDETLADATFGVSTNAIRLARNVEMYQWTEDSSSTTRKKLGGGTETETTYTYSKTWSGLPIDSAEFKERAGHENPSRFPYESETWQAQSVTLGAFDLTSEQIADIRAAQPLEVKVSSLPGAIAGGFVPDGKALYLGTSPAAPEIGDVRISFSQVLPQDVSVVAEQNGDSFRPFQTEAGRALSMLEPGNMSAQAMFDQAQSRNAMLTWIVRLVGMIVCCVGFAMVFAPLAVIADVVPLAGTVVGAGTTLIAALLGGTLSCITIALAWLTYRPLIGVPVLIVAVALIVLAVKKLKSVAKARAAAAPREEPQDMPEAA